MICWSCQKAAGDGMVCASCNAVQPPNPQADYFQVFGIDRTFAIDMSELERRYKEMTKVLHPDRFARADPQARRASLERSVQLNEAWRTLRDPVHRAEYLLALEGIVLGEPGASGKAPWERPTMPVPQALLLEILELRESLADAQTAKDVPKMKTLTAGVRSRLDGVMADVARAFAADRPDLPALAARLLSVRYYKRFLEEAQGLLEAAQPEGSGYAG